MCACVCVSQNTQVFCYKFFITADDGTFKAGEEKRKRGGWVDVGFIAVRLDELPQPGKRKGDGRTKVRECRSSLESGIKRITSAASKGATTARNKRTTDTRKEG